jgi:hypothetical protein
MKYSIVLERIEEPECPEGYYQAYIPRLGLAPHGLGVEGARAAARDLVVLWLAEKAVQDETVPGETDSMFATNGTFRAILRQANLSEEEFKRL